MIALAADAQFAPGSVIACYFGWLHELIAQMIAWTESQGLDPAAARLLVAQMTRAAATIIRERTDASPAQPLSRSLPRHAPSPSQASRTSAASTLSRHGRTQPRVSPSGSRGRH